jgi:hypothetical protein
MEGLERLVFIVTGGHFLHPGVIFLCIPHRGVDLAWIISEIIEGAEWGFRYETASGAAGGGFGFVLEGIRVSRAGVEGAGTLGGGVDRII